jgi:hypothetical protein
VIRVKDLVPESFNVIDRRLYGDDDGPREHDHDYDFRVHVHAHVRVRVRVRVLVLLDTSFHHDE